MEMWIGIAIMKMVWRLLKKLKIRVSYNSAIPLLGIYPKELKSGFQNDISTPRFIVLYCIHNSQDMETIQMFIRWIVHE